MYDTAELFITSFASIFSVEKKDNKLEMIEQRSS